MYRFQTKLKFILFGFIALLANQGLHAVNAKPGLIKTQQPDGSTINILLVGDETDHYAISEEGYLLTSDEEGYYVLAELNDAGIPVAIKERTAESSKLNDAQRKRLVRADENSLLEISKRRETEGKRSVRKAPGRCTTDFPSTGEQKAIVILVEFANKKFQLENPNEFYTRMLNEEGFSEVMCTGSARDFFLYNSDGKYQPTFDVYGPVQVSRNYSYYGGNDVWGNDARPNLMVTEACTLLDDQIDFKEYDRDGNGIIDNVYIFYAGFGEADGGNSKTIWPHSANITDFSEEKFYFDGVLLDHYACSNEIQATTELPDGIGTFCHEFGHVLGLPDLYATFFFTNAFTPNTWDIMDRGSYNNMSRTPPNYSSYERYALGWLEPIELELGEVELKPLGESKTAYIARTERDDEYFLFENRQKIGFDAYLPHHGMLVWHIDFYPRVWDGNMVNNTGSHQYVDLIEADDLRTYDSVEGDAFPGSANITEFSNRTSPAFVDWSNNEMPFSISNIKEWEDGVITFNVENPFAPGGSSEVNEIAEGDGLVVMNNVIYNKTGNVGIYDLGGRKVAESGIGNLQLPSGIYFAVKDGMRRKIIIK